MEFSRILSPIDFSDTSLRALTYGTALAKWYGAQLEVLHVVPAFEYEITDPVVAAGDLGPVLHAPGREAVLAQIRTAITLAGACATNHQAVTLEGRVHEIIVNRATAQSADVIVMGTHGRGGFARLFLGSVTEKVVRTAIRPVLTVPPAAPASLTSPVAFKRILCAIDYAPSSLKALEYALELGRQTNGRVSVLHVLEYMDAQERQQPATFDPCYQAIAQSGRRRQQRIDRAREWLHALLAEHPITWCNVEEIVALNAQRAYREILQRAIDIGADLIVMGAQGTGGIELMLYGSNTHNVVRAAKCAVLTVRAA
jgi:nucleotide-binding universal stress UspA family protein